MKLGRVALYTMLVILIGCLAVGTYVFLTINRKSPVSELTVKSTYVTPGSFSTINLEQDQIIDHLDQHINSLDELQPISSLKLEAAKNASIQLVRNDQAQITKNVVLTYEDDQSLSDLKTELKEGDSFRVEEEVDGSIKYQSLDKQVSYYFPDENTLVIEQSLKAENSVQKEEEIVSESFQLAVEESAGFSLSFDKSDAIMQSTIERLPDYVSNRFEKASIHLNESSKTPFYLQFEMDNAFNARTFEMILPRALKEGKSKFEETKGVFSMDNKTIRLQSEEFIDLQKIIEDLEVESGGKMVYLILKEKKDTERLLEILSNHW